MSDETRQIPVHPNHDPGIPTANDRIAFSGRTVRKTAAVRGGVVVGAGLLLAIGAAVAMGASPAPSGSINDGQALTFPGAAAGPLDDPGFGDGEARGRPGRHGDKGFGDISVTAVSGSDISLATDDGWKRTITIASSTMITRAGAAATLADLSVGDSVHFRQTRNADGTFTITAIEVVLPRAAGAVTAVGTDTITITLHDGTSQTVRTTGSTTYRIGEDTGSRTDVTIGMTIVASGEKAADGTLTATTVRIRLPHAVGRVTATTGNTITISRRDGTSLTIHVGSDTDIAVAGVTNATVADVMTGMGIAAKGTQRSDGSLDATAIRAGQFHEVRGHHGFGPGSKNAPDATAAPDASAGANG